jgi:hypothetical protein
MNIRMRASVGAALLVALTSCASPFAEVPETSDSSQPFKELAARPSEEAAEEAKAPALKAGKDGGKSQKGVGSDTDGQSSVGDDGSGGGDDPEDAPEGAPFTLVGSLSDPRADVSDDTPGYGDALSIEIASDGARARISVTLGDRIPGELRAGEVEGVGVDLFRGSGDYQVFASGEPGGWYGYLYTPDGFVEYEGSFAVSGRTITFIVPWSALGGTDPGTFSAFVDWTGPPKDGRNGFSQDTAPDEGTADFSP